MNHFASPSHVDMKFLASSYYYLYLLVFSWRVVILFTLSDIDKTFTPTITCNIYSYGSEIGSYLGHGLLGMKTILRL